MVTRLLALALFTTLALGDQDPVRDPEPETCREVYVEAWFLETAEGDLEGALATYRRCIELGAPEDRELVARAWWRMGMIARARGEAVVAAELLARVVEDFAGTEAAARAVAALETPAPAGPESEAVARAHADLRDMLLTDDVQDVSLKRLNAVFGTLSAQQIAADSARLGMPLVGILLRRGSGLAPEHAAKLVELATTADTPSAQAALRSIAMYGEQPLPEQLFELAGVAPRGLDAELARLFVSRADDRAMAALQALLERSPELLVWEPVPEGGSARVSHLRDDLWALVYNEHAVAGEVFERFLASVPRTRADLDALADFFVPLDVILVLPTPASARMRAFFPELTAAGRDRLASGIRRPEDVPREAVELVLGDPEPAVRIHGLMRLLGRGDRASLAEALERARGEAATLRAELIFTAAARTAPPVSAAELVEATDAGPLREYAYRALIWGADGESEVFGRQGRAVPDVLRLGLGRGDPELLQAIFGSDPASLDRDPNHSSVRAAALRGLRNGPRTGESVDLSTILFTRAMNLSNEQLRTRAVELAGDVLGPADLAAFRERALRDPSPRVRSAALQPRSLEGISTATATALLLDPDDYVFDRARRAWPSPEAFIAAIPELSFTRRREILGEARKPGYESLVRALFEGARDGDPKWLVETAFDYLEERDAAVLIAGVNHANPTVRRRAHEQLAKLQLPAELYPVAAGVEYPEAERSSIQSGLLAAEDEVAQALLRWNLNQLETRLDHPANRREMALGLASLGAREELIERALDTQGPSRQVGGMGLVELGDQDGMRRALQASAYPAELVEFALRLELADECYELWVAGRLGLAGYLAGISATDREDELVRVLLGPRDVGELTYDRDRFERAVAAAAKRADAEALSRAAARFGSLTAVSELVILEAWEHIVEDLPAWRESAREAALIELSRRIGEPVEWPQYVTEQRALQDELRVRLGLPPR